MVDHHQYVAVDLTPILHAKTFPNISFRYLFVVEIYSC